MDIVRSGLAIEEMNGTRVARDRIIGTGLALDKITAQDGLLLIGTISLTYALDVLDLFQ